MKCNKCGAEIQENAKFCPSCGTPVAIEKEIPASEEKPTETKAKKGGVMKTAAKVIGGIAIIAMIGSCMSGNKDSKSSSPAKAPTKVVSQLNAEQVKFLQTVGITEPKVTSEKGKVKKFDSKGNTYKLYTNDKNGIVKVTKLIGDREWSVWDSDHGQWDVPENDGKYIIVDIDDLDKQLKNNAARASKNYKGVDVKFTGKIGTIDSDGDYISVRGQDRYAILNSFHCRLKDKKQKEIIINKNQGSKVTIKGKITDVGEILGYRVKVDEIQ